MTACTLPVGDRARPGGEPVQARGALELGRSERTFGVRFQRWVLRAVMAADFLILSVVRCSKPFEADCAIVGRPQGPNRTFSGEPVPILPRAGCYRRRTAPDGCNFDHLYIVPTSEICGPPCEAKACEPGTRGGKHTLGYVTLGLSGPQGFSAHAWGREMRFRTSEGAAPANVFFEGEGYRTDHRPGSFVGPPGKINFIDQPTRL